MNSRRIFTKTFVLGALSLFVLALGPAEAGAGQRTFHGSPSQVGPAVRQAGGKAITQIPGFLKFIRKSKTSEAGLGLKAVGDGAVDWGDKTNQGMLPDSESLFMPKSTQMNAPSGGKPAEFMPSATGKGMGAKGYFIKNAPMSSISELADVPAPSIEPDEISSDPLGASTRKKQGGEGSSSSDDD